LKDFIALAKKEMRKKRFNEAMDEDRNRRQRENHYTRRKLMWALQDTKANRSNSISIDRSRGNAQRGRAIFKEFKLAQRQEED
jgi:hypothetical protein